MLHAPLFGRPVPSAPPSPLQAPLTPGDYLALRRRASGLSINEVAERIAANGMLEHARRMGKSAAQADLRSLLRQLETPGVVARQRSTLDLIARGFAFDADVYRQLATAPAERHPRICRGCGCSQNDACIGEPFNCAWADDDTCTRCTDGDRR